MSANLEIKIRLDEFERILDLLKKSNARFSGILTQKDVYYNVEEFLLKLRIEDGKNYLIKYKRDESGKDRFSHYNILSLSGEKVDDYLSEIFNIEAVVEKKRTVFIIDNTRIHLDEVKNLGKFIELETVVTANYEDAKSEFETVMKILELDRKKQILNSYKNLISPDDFK